MSVYEHEQSRAKQNRSGRRREMVAVQCWAQIISLVAQGVRVTANCTAQTKAWKLKLLETRAQTPGPTPCSGPPRG